MLELLDNIVWNSLAGPQSKFASGADDIKRFAHGFSPIVGFRDTMSPNFAALRPFCQPGEQFYTDIWSGPVPNGWRIESESTMFKMVWQGASSIRDEAEGAVPLDSKHAEQALELALLTRPGPFGLRTIELGEYFGYFDDGILIAMAGERMHAGSLREISGVCTHPDFQGSGLARRLMTKLLGRQMSRGELPFLHVMAGNAGAQRLYERMGFRKYRETVVRVMTCG